MLGGKRNSPVSMRTLIPNSVSDRTSNKGQSRQEVQKARGNETVTKKKT